MPSIGSLNSLALRTFTGRPLGRFFTQTCYSLGISRLSAMAIQSIGERAADQIWAICFVEFGASCRAPFAPPGRKRALLG
jgi:hypothetical protein